MKLITNAEAALLGLLCEKDRHPYEIEKEVQNRDMRVWTDLSMSSIYKLLRKLEKEGLVQSETTVTKENRTRKTYHVTPEGRKAIRTKLAEILTEPEHIKWRMDIAISNLMELPQNEILVHLKSYRKTLSKQIKDYQALEKYLQDDGCPDYRMALARRPVHLFKGEMKWLDSYLKELETA